MPDENGFATPAERGDYVPDSDMPPPEVTDEGSSPSSADTDDNSGDGDSADSSAEGDGGRDGGDGDAGVTAAGTADADGATGTETAESDADQGTDAAAEGGEAAATDTEGQDTEESAGEPSAEAEGEQAEAQGQTEKPAKEADTDADGVPRTRVQRVRKSRFDQKVAQLKKARERIAELEAKQAQQEQQQGAEVTDLQEQLTAKNQEVADAVKDGKGNIAELMAEAQAIQGQITTAQMQAMTQQTQAATSEATEFRSTLDDVESLFPFLRPGDDTYDQERVDEVSELVQTFQKAGQSATEALLRTINLLYPDTEEEVAQSAAEPATQSATKPAAKQTPRKTDVAKNVAAAKKQPPPLADAGDDSNKLGVSKQIDVTKLTEEEFDALPKETLRRLRGDYL